MKSRKETKSVTPIRLRAGDILILIDVLNDLEFPGGEKLKPWAERAADRILATKKKAYRARIPVIYVNDNFGIWRGGFEPILAHATRKGARGRSIAQALRPHTRDYCIVKPRHSAFYATSLDPLLEELSAERIILTGFATNLCVFFTAHDAHMRKYELLVLSDCCAAETDFDHNVALTQLESFCGALIRRSDQLRL